MGRDRDMATQTRRGRHWCWGCDAVLLSDGNRCWNCGKKDDSKRAKKPAPMDHIDPHS